MAKELKKNGRRLKKSVRKTLGTMFLISSILVAAIPVDGLQASNGSVRAASRPDGKYKVTISQNPTKRGTEIGTSTIPTMSGSNGMDGLIPEVPYNATIYTTDVDDQGAIFQFAYISVNGEWVAILLGYQADNLRDNYLEIPEKVSAYIQPTGNLGTGNGYVAASQSGEPLFYEHLEPAIRKIRVQAKDENGNLLWDDEEHTIPTMVDDDETYYVGDIRPCYATDPEWKELDLADFFYVSSGATYTSNKAQKEDGSWQTYTGYERSGSTNSNHQWIKNGVVKYIGNQYLDSVYDSDTGTYSWNLGTKTDPHYITAETADRGVFANKRNIGTLKIGEQIAGVGNYAFYNCTGLNEISFGNGLKVIGNWAFAGCTKMTKVTVPTVSNLGQLGDHAFYMCTSLTDIQVPHSVQYIGDYAFAKCTVLGSVELCDFQQGTSGSVLTEIGWNAFEDCETLHHLVLPENYSETLDISVFKGCKNLHYVTSRNKDMTFKDDDNLISLDDFKAMLEGEPVSGEFYFEGLANSKLYELCRDNCFAFSYIVYNSNSKFYESMNKYELTTQTIAGDENGRTTFVVNSSNELISSAIGSSVKKLEIPKKIGPYHISKIGSYIFADNCSLEYVSIPQTVESIGDGAFKGCHNLENVIFENDTVIIGKDAFKTQDFTGIRHTGADCKTTGEVATEGNVPKKKLHFVGAISEDSTPFRYAMSPDGSYNNGSQAKTFITYYSGWPTNLEIQYHYDDTTKTGYSELVNFPSFSELKDYAKMDPNDSSKPLYAYMTPAYLEAAENALLAYSANPPLPLTEDQQDFIDSALNLEIPKGVQAIKDDLFKEKENKDKAAGFSTLEKTVNIYGLDEIEENDFKGCTSLTEANIYGDPKTIADNAFSGCTKLEKVAVNGNTSKIGDHAFEGCTALEDVTLSPTVSDLGICPFKDCPKLNNVVFQGDDYYTCADSIIFGLKDGKKTKIVECLGGKTSKYVKASEVTEVTDIAEEAFAKTAVREIDLTSSNINQVPQWAFADTPNLRTVKLPSTCVMLNDNAFSGSEVDRIETSQYLTLVGQDAFKDIKKPKSDVTICSPRESYMHQYALLNGFDYDDTPQVVYYEVIFRDWNAELGKNVQVGEPQRILAGEDAVPPEPLGKEGEIFVEWDPDYREISDDTVCTAQYTKEHPDAHKLTVTFLDWNDKVLKTVLVVPGEDAEAPFNPEREGYTFTGWRPAITNVQESFTTYAQYEKKDPSKYTVTFLDWNDTVLKTVSVLPGEDADPPFDPVREGYTFTGWRPAFTNVQGDMTTYAQYEKIDSTMSQYTVRFIDYDDTVLYVQRVDAGGNAIPPQSPSREGYVFTGWRPAITGVVGDLDTFAQYEKIGTNTDPGTNPDPGNTNPPGNTTPDNGNNNNNNGGNTATSKTYTMTVINGSGSGSYVAGTLAVISANDPPAGQEFSNWTIDPAETPIASKVLSATVVTIPEKNVTVTAHYKAKTTSTTGGGSSSNNASGNKPSSGVVSSGTTIVIDKNGLSNTGVVSATVKGSSDNFTIKVSESSAASEAVLKALQAEYGDISNIKYFPMDISLYDAKGTTKISDTTGLSINITLPLPDSLINYAGNNKVAGVVNNRLDKLAPKFTTIDGVACVSFTAEHFSPYVIYVETDNLTASVISDNTPKTGDGIHPKWFLSIGLACVSMVFFMKKDKRKLQKVRVS